MKPIIAISMGDAAGIGPEIIIKALSHKKLYDICTPIVVGDKVPLLDAMIFSKKELHINCIKNASEATSKFGTLDLIDMGLLSSTGYTLGKVSYSCGNAAFQYVKTATELALKKEISAIVTSPINKEAINLAGHHFAGHTEILAHLTGVKKYAMMLIGGGLRVIHVTTHVSMREACDLITKQQVYNTIHLACEGLKLLGIENPKIGVAGFNAHSSENGLFGDQEAKGIIPAIQQAQSEGINVEGPVPPDTIFVKALAGQYDIVVAMYHDQGHIPLKLCGFKLDAKTRKFTLLSGINCTIGLPIIRTSVDHGTAFDKAGEGIANEDSLIEAIEAAVTMSSNFEPK